MALNGLICADVPLSNYSLALLLYSRRMETQRKDVKNLLYIRFLTSPLCVSIPLCPQLPV